MSFWAYILHCRGGVFYTGHTDNLDVRIGQHQGGTMPGFTQKYAPVALVWSQEFPSRLEALDAERRHKGWRGQKKLALIRNDWATNTPLAKRKQHPSAQSGRTGKRE